MDRVTARYAEQQVARLARELGCKMHYTHQGKDLCEVESTWTNRGLAEPANYGTKDAWVLDGSAAAGWLNLYAYAEQGGFYHPLHGYSDGTYKAAQWWELAGFAIDALKFQREQVSA